MILLFEGKPIHQLVKGDGIGVFLIAEVAQAWLGL